MTVALAKPIKGSRSKYIRFRGLKTFSMPRVDVEFVDGLSMEELRAEISKLSNPQVVVWYGGCYGLKEAGVQFYRDYLISPTLDQNAKATFWLVDLTAWAAFQNPMCSINNFSSCCDKIGKFGDKQIRCIKSADFFKKIQELNDLDLVNYFKKALHRSFISQSSEHFPNKNIRTKEIFSGNCPVACDWYHYDTSKSYSVFQYLEGCWIVNEIFIWLARVKNISNIQIIFALPNDENKYYNDQQSSFKKDVTFLISKYCKKLEIENISLQIKFLSFRYGSHSLDRPYSASGSILRSSQVSYETVTGRSKICKISSPKASYTSRYLESSK